MTPKKFTVHCSASANGKKWDIASIRKEHVENRGFSDVGYHYVIQPDGEIQRGRALNVQGAHVEGHNEDNVGVCMIGTDRWTSAQFRALFQVFEDLRRIYPAVNASEVYGHYEFDSAVKQGKTCPNMKAKKLVLFLALGDMGLMKEYIKELV